MSEGERPNQPQRYCTNCGAEIRSDTRFCVSCGASLLPGQPDSSNANSGPRASGASGFSGKAARDLLFGLGRSAGASARTVRSSVRGSSRGPLSWFRGLPYAARMLILGLVAVSVLVAASPIIFWVGWVLVAVTGAVAIGVSLYRSSFSKRWGVAAGAALAFTLVAGIAHAPLSIRRDSE